MPGAELRQAMRTAQDGDARDRRDLLRGFAFVGYQVARTVAAAFGGKRFPTLGEWYRDWGLLEDALPAEQADLKQLAEDARRIGEDIRARDPKRNAG